MSEPENRPEKIEDSEDYTVQRRLKSVFDIRKEIHQTRKQIRYISQKPNERFQAVCAYRSLVESYLLEIEPLLRRYGDGEYCLVQKDFGSFTLQTETRDTSYSHMPGIELFFPNAPVDNYKDNKTSWIPVDSGTIPESEKFEFQGLNALFNTPDTLKLIGQPYSPQSDYSKQYTYLKETQIPMSVLDDMVRTMNEFVSGIGFELEPEEEDDPAHI